MKISSIVIGLLLCASQATLAASKSDYQIGFSPAYNIFSASSSEGDSKSLSNINVLKFNAKHKLSKDTRLLFSTEFFDEKPNPSTSEIGQNIEGIIFNVQYQKRMNFSRQLKFWVGGGLSTQSISYENRVYVDSDGFLDTNRLLNNRSDKDLALVLNITKSNFFIDNSDLYIEYLHAFNNGLSGISIGINFYPEFLNF